MDEEKKLMAHVSHTVSVTAERNAGASPEPAMDVFRIQSQPAVVREMKTQDSGRKDSPYPLETVDPHQSGWISQGRR